MQGRRLNTSYSVSTNRWLVDRYAYVEERAFTMLAGWIWDSPELEHKIELGRFTYEDALHADALRRRASELFPPTVEPPRPTELGPLERLCNEIANTDDRVERLVGLFRVLKPMLPAAYRRHLAETDDITDWPTSTLLKRLVTEETEQIAWGQRVLVAQLTGPPTHDRAQAWEEHLRDAMAAIGGIRDEPVAGNDVQLRNPSPPERQRYTAPARDSRYRVVPIADFQTPQPDQGPNAIVRLALYTNCNGELEAEEIIGRVIAYAPDLPWGMRLDLARQLWDEARHAELSWRRMDELGGPPVPAPSVAFLWPLYAGDTVDPLEDLIVLQRAAEGRATEAHRARVGFIGQEMGDPTTARLYEYIVADERAHIGYSDWIHRLVGNDTKRVDRLNEIQLRAEAAIAAYMKRRADATAAGRSGTTAR